MGVIHLATMALLDLAVVEEAAAEGGISPITQIREITYLAPVAVAVALDFLAREVMELLGLVSRMALKEQVAAVVPVEQLEDSQLALQKTQVEVAHTAVALVHMGTSTQCRELVPTAASELSASSGALVVAIRRTPQTSN